MNQHFSHRALATRRLAWVIVFVFFAGQAQSRAAVAQPEARTHYSRGSDSDYSAGAVQKAAATDRSPALAQMTSDPSPVPHAASAGLIINATFDSTVTNDPNAAAIEATINSAIARFESMFSDPITVSILFRYSTVEATGAPLPSGLIASSRYVVYPVQWGTYINALVADARSPNDATANAHLPAITYSANVKPSSAGGRAVGLDTPPAMFANGAVGSGGPYDGIVTINSAAPVRFSRPPSPGNFDGLTGIQHEMDEVLGLGSHLDFRDTEARPEDLFSFSSPGNRNLGPSGVRYFSIDGGKTDIVNLNQNPNVDYGDWLSPACPQSNPLVQNAIGCRGQAADISATSPEGISLDVLGYDPAGAPTPTPTPTPNPTPIPKPSPTPGPNARLANISTRLDVGTGANALIGGFIITGNTPRKMIVRALGPSLPVAGALRDPQLELHNPSGVTIASNDNWGDSPQKDQIIASGVAPSNAAESAIVTTLNPGKYTGVLSGVKSTTGIGLIEVYDLDSTAGTRFANISTRGLVQTGNNVLIGGLIIAGQDPLRILFRAIGPSLANGGVANALRNPTLELHDGNGALLAFNDDWRSTQEAEIRATGIPPGYAAESAIVRVLSKGNYTAVVRGAGGTTGVALVEAYDIR